MLIKVDEMEPTDALESVPLDYFLDHVSLFKYMLPNSIERILIALGRSELI